MTVARRTALVVAVLFIIATVASVLSAVLLSPYLEDANYLGALFANETNVILAVFCMFIASASIVGIPITLFPLFRRHSEAAALWFFAARLVEAIFFIAGGVFTLSLLSLARDYAGSSAPDAAYFLTLGQVINDTAETSFNVGTMLFFSCSALILSIVFYQTNLVPRWLSIWKFIGAILLLVQWALITLGAATPMLESVLFLPIAINEMVLAVWLIFKGFDDEAVERLLKAKAA